MCNTKTKVRGYDFGWDTTEPKNSDWNLIIEIQNCVNTAKLCFNTPPQISLHQLKLARQKIDQFISKHEC